MPLIHRWTELMICLQGVYSHGWASKCLKAMALEISTGPEWRRIVLNGVVQRGVRIHTERQKWTDCRQPSHMWLEEYLGE